MSERHTTREYWLQRAHFFVVHGADPAAWARRHGIEPFTHPCPHCGASLATTLPFAIGTLRGLVAPTCACGNANTPYCIVRVAGHGDLLTGAS
jgi:hypothetical protein